MDYFEYDTTPDPADKRRLSRARYALHSLPAMSAALLLALLLRGIMSLMGNGEGLGEAFDAIVLFSLASYFLFRHQHKQLERRCNDAETSQTVEKCLNVLGTLCALCNGVFPFYGKPLVFVLLLQFAYGIALPDNPRNNIHGAAKKELQAARKYWFLGCLNALILLFYLIY